MAVADEDGDGSTWRRLAAGEESPGCEPAPPSSGLLRFSIIMAAAMPELTAAAEDGQRGRGGEVAIVDVSVVDTR